MLVRSLIDVVTCGVVIVLISLVVGYFVEGKESSIMIIKDSFRNGDIKFGILLILVLMTNIVTWPIQLIWFAVTGVKKGVAKLF